MQTDGFGANTTVDGKKRDGHMMLRVFQPVVIVRMEPEILSRISMMGKVSFLPAWQLHGWVTPLSMMQQAT